MILPCILVTREQHACKNVGCSKTPDLLNPALARCAKQHVLRAYQNVNSLGITGVESCLVSSVYRICRCNWMHRNAWI
jgi:hypothetical protein